MGLHRRSTDHAGDVIGRSCQLRHLGGSLIQLNERFATSAEE
jgi:hypothetical protein